MANSKPTGTAYLDPELFEAEINDSTIRGGIIDGATIINSTFNESTSRIMTDEAFSTIMVGQYLGNSFPDATGHIVDVSLAAHNNHLLYTSAMTDATAFGTANYFTSAVGTVGNSAGFEVPISAFSPDTYNGGNPGDSIFVSAVVNFATQPSALATLAGNSGDGQVYGFQWYTTAAGGIQMYTSSAAGQFARGTASAAVGSNTDVRVSMYVDGISKAMFAWVNGKMIGNNEPLVATGSLYTANSPWWFGGGGLVGRDRATQACRWKDIVILKAPPGYYIKSPQFIDLLLRNHSGRILTKEDISR